MSDFINKMKNDKKKLGIGLIAIALIIICIFDAITKLQETPSDTININKDNITVISTSFPALDMTKNVLGGKINGSVLIEDYDDSKNYEPTPIDIEKINNADIFVYNGDYMEPWVSSLLKNNINNDSLIIIDTSKNIQFTKNSADKNMVKIKEISGMSIKINENDTKTEDNKNNEENNKPKDENKTDNSNLSDVDQEAFNILQKMSIGNQVPKDTALYNKLDELKNGNDEHVYWTVNGKKYKFYIGKVISFYELSAIEDANETSSSKLSDDDIYYWMSLKNAEQMVSNIKEQIISQSPEMTADVTTNSEKYIKEIQNLASKYKNKKTKYPLIITNKVNISSMFSYLELDYATLYGSNMEDDPSTNDIFAIVEAIDYLDIPCIYTDETGGNSYDKKISQDSGAELKTIDSMTIMPTQKVVDDSNYLNIMKSNLDALNLK